VKEVKRVAWQKGERFIAKVGEVPLMGHIFFLRF
jgi:hypothetical protein